MIHDRTKYDLVQGRLDRSLAYNQALASVGKEALQKNPSIQVVIDHSQEILWGKGKHTYTTVQRKIDVPL